MPTSGELVVYILGGIAVLSAIIGFVMAVVYNKNGPAAMWFIGAVLCAILLSVLRHREVEEAGRVKVIPHRIPPTKVIPVGKD